MKPSPPLMLQLRLFLRRHPRLRPLVFYLLAWEVFVFRSAGAKRDDLVARWTTSVFGLDWLDRLVREGKATDRGGDGYPNRYEVPAGVLLPILSRGLPANGSPLVIGNLVIGNGERAGAGVSDCCSRRDHWGG